MTIKKKGSKINIVSCGSFNSFEYFLKKVNIKLPVIIVTDGKGVLNKRLDSKNEIDSSWRKNFDFNSLYYTEYSSPPYNFVSFCRKQFVDEIINTFQSKGSTILDIYIGPLYSALLYPAINEDIVSNNTSMMYTNGALHDILRNDDDKQKNYVIEENSISQYQLPLFGAAIHYFVQDINITSKGSEKIQPQEIIYKKAFNTVAVVSIVSFLVSLLASYIMIGHYADKNTELNQKNLFSGQTYKQILDLEKQKNLKRQILNDTGHLSNKFLSFYCYELLQSIPHEITIVEMAAAPLSTEIKDQKKVLFEHNKIIIKGSTVRESSFTKWMALLRNMNWIKKFEILEIRKDKKDIQHFKIQIFLNNV